MLIEPIFEPLEQILVFSLHQVAFVVIVNIYIYTYIYNNLCYNIPVYQAKDLSMYKESGLKKKSTQKLLIVTCWQWEYKFRTLLEIQA